MSSTLSAQKALLECDIYAGAFSGEVVFAVESDSGSYEGIAPIRYAKFHESPSTDRAVRGAIEVRLIQNGGERAKVITPDEELLDVAADAVTVAEA